jgi:superfamily I DNA and/or RNA helicase
VPISHQKETLLQYNLPSQDDIDDILKTRRVAFFDSLSANLTIVLAQRIRRFYGDRFDPQKTLGIIVTYRHQIAAIREAMPDVAIDTVERYQGSQRDVIIYDVGVSRQYQLDFLTASTFTDDEGQTIDRKLNVALTRARKQMLIVGRADILRQNALYRQLIDSFLISQ